MKLTDIAAEALHKDRAAIKSEQRIEGGLTNENWLVRADDTAIVVRLGNRATEALQIDRESEANVLAAVARAGIGPPVLLCAPDRHLLITEHLTGSVWTARDARQPANVRRIAELLRVLHALPAPQGVRRIDLSEIVSGYWNSLLQRGRAVHTGCAELRGRASEFIAQLKQDAQTALCHNDVHHLNVIDNGQLHLVDWEYAGIGDPYFDLASVCCYHEYSDDLRRELLRAYFGKERPSAEARLDRVCWVFNYIRDLWFAVREME